MPKSKAAEADAKAKEEAAKQEVSFKEEAEAKSRFNWSFETNAW